MKSIFNLLKLALIIILGSSIFIFSDCTKVKATDPCEETERPLIEATFNLKVQIEYSDGLPYEGTVTYIIWKNYCDGGEKGRFTLHGNTNASGYWNSSYIYTYKFENTKDKVQVNFLMESGNAGSTSYDLYYYADIENNKDITKTYDITLPFASTD